MNLGHSEKNVSTRESMSHSNQYLTFMLAGEEYGVDILRVQEIKGWNKATPIPNTPDYIQGVMNLRGTIVPIVDLRNRFGLERVDYGITTVVIVLKVMASDGNRTMGIVVDAVSDVYNVSADEIKQTPDFGRSVSVDFIKGLAAVSEKMVIILDIDHLLNSSAIKNIDAMVN